MRVEASDQYIVWWHELEACSGLSGDINAVSFYRADGYDFMIAGHDYWGYWMREGNKIIMANFRMGDKKLVQHEELHALLQRSDHPAKYFNGACGDLTLPSGE